MKKIVAVVSFFAAFIALAFMAGCSTINNTVIVMPDGGTVYVGAGGVKATNAVASVESTSSVKGTNGVISTASQKSSGTLAIGINNSMNVPKTTNPNTTVSVIPQ